MTLLWLFLCRFWRVMAAPVSPDCCPRHLWHLYDYFCAGSEELWPYLLALTAAPAIVSAIVLPFFPESPRYLLLNKNDKAAATKGEHPILASLTETEKYLTFKFSPFRRFLSGTCHSTTVNGLCWRMMGCGVKMIGPLWCKLLCPWCQGIQIGQLVSSLCL